jgi:hypothetical protein
VVKRDLVGKDIKNIPGSSADHYQMGWDVDTSTKTPRVITPHKYEVVK